VATLDAGDVTWTSAGAGDPTNIKALVCYSDTAVNKDCIFFMDLTTDGGVTAISLLSGDITIQWNASGIYTNTV